MFKIAILVANIIIFFLNTKIKAIILLKYYHAIFFTFRI